MLKRIDNYQNERKYKITLKENMISVDIEVIVDLLDIKEEEIKVRYKIPDTQTLYEYKIEMRNYEKRKF